MKRYREVRVGGVVVGWPVRTVTDSRGEIINRPRPEYGVGAPPCPARDRRHNLRQEPSHCSAGERPTDGSKEPGAVATTTKEDQVVGTKGRAGLLHDAFESWHQVDGA